MKEASVCVRIASLDAETFTVFNRQEQFLFENFTRRIRRQEQLIEARKATKDDQPLRSRETQASTYHVCDMGNLKVERTK